MSYKGSFTKTDNFLEFVYGFYQGMKSNDISLVYEGEVTHQITKAFTSLTESNMANQEEDSSVQKKVFHVMVECLQNVSKHADDFTDTAAKSVGRGIFMVSKGEEHYYVITGNVVDNNKIDGLRDILENINSMDRDALKALYKKQIKEGRLSNKGGAGLGFIDIARKTGEKFDFHFLPIDEETSFFVLTSKIVRK